MDRNAYRPDIDGLRAVAIVPVVLFHAGLPALKGGFAGVDVFFVISGFLITGLLYKELEQKGSLSILSFYARRVARIFPSLILVVAATVIAGAALLSSTLFEVHSLAKSAVASMAFAANFYFLTATSDYFAAAAADLPLLHTWSLAVEEQYYLAWPLVMILGAQTASLGASLRIRCLVAVLAITASSALLCAYLSVTHPAQAFYLPVTRAWELGIGSALALAPSVASRTFTAAAAGFVGFILVLIGFFVVRQGAGFPFPLALFPTVGTLLMIWSGDASPTGPIARLLSTPPLVSIGRVSYAWYLWHWPLLSFAHILTLGEASPLLRLALVAVSLLLAYGTVRLVETPIRFGVVRKMKPVTIVGTGLLAGGLTIALAGGVYAAARGGLLGDDPRISSAFSDRPPHQAACLIPESVGAINALPASCQVNGSAPRLVLWGDSHADQWAPALETWSQAHPGWRVEQATLQACPPLLGLTPTDAAGGPHQPFALCRQFNELVAARLAQGRPAQTIVVLGGNWLPRAGDRSPSGDDGPPPVQQYFDVKAIDRPSSLAALEKGLEASLSLLDHADLRSVVVLQAPAMRKPAAACVERLGAGRCGVSSVAFRQRAKLVNDVILRVVGRHSRSAALNPADILCNATTCPSELDNAIAYYDLDHVAASTARSARSLASWTAILDTSPRIQPDSKKEPDSPLAAYR